MKRQRKDGWSEADKQYLIDHFETLTNEEIARALNRSTGSIQTMASKELGLKRSSTALSNRLVETWKSRDGTWTESEKQYLIDNWQTKTKAEMATELGRSIYAIKSMGVKEMGLKKTDEAKAVIAKRNTSTTKFKKGGLPYNTIFGDQQVVRVRKNKSGPAYKWIRIGFKQWKQYHIWIWEQANGPVPEGHLITFRDGDQMNCKLENLILSTPAEHAIRNSASLNLTDNWVANTITRDKELKPELLKHPELIELQRTKIKLNRLIKNEITGN